jgi:hypothetical protein
VVFETVKINVVKVGENVSKKNMNPRKENEASGAPMI